MVQAPLSPARRAPSPSAPSGMAIQDMLRILKKRVWLIVGIWFLVFVVTGVGTYIWAAYFPTYRSEGIIDVKSPIAPFALKPDTLMPNKDIMQQFINTHAIQIISLTNLMEAAQDPTIQQTTWYKSLKDTPSELLLDMQDRIRATPLRMTSLIRVSFSWHQPKECRDIVNVVVDTYLRKATESARSGTSTKLQQYTTRAEDLARSIQSKISEMKIYRASHNIPFMEYRQSHMGDQVAALTAAMEEARTELAQAEAMYKMYNEPDATLRMRQSPEMRAAIDSDYIMRTYNYQKTQMEILLATAKEKGENNRAVKDIERQLKPLQVQIDKREAELLDNFFRDAVNGTRAMLNAAHEKVTDLEERLAVAKADLGDLEIGLAEYADLQTSIETLTAQKQEIDNFTMGLAIQSSDPELVRIEKVASATTPLERSLPRWAVNIPAGFVIGLLLGVGLAFLIEFMSTKVSNPVDVTRQLNLPLLGQIPSQEDDEASPANMHQLLIESPHSVLAESFRQLRTNFVYSAPPEQQRLILVTSCSPEEGKTCIAVNLATSLAMGGRKVLLVDANLHRPSIAEAFNITDECEGLTNVLVGHANPLSLIKKSATPNLDILLAGPLPPNPAELLNGQYLSTFIRQFSDKYQTIIFDGPPMLLMSDALVLAASMDGVILTVRAGTCARGTVMRAREQLRRVGAKLIGVVLNDVKVMRGGYLRDLYRDYYEYQSRAALPAEGKQK
jgi:capsular exopolysaccharide synthesis family protein